MDEIGSIIGLVLNHVEDETKLEEARKRVQNLTNKFELYPSL